MSLVKELLLSCIVMMHISFMASQEIEVGKLRENIKSVVISLCNLWMAEKDYVKYIFNGEPPKEYTLYSLEPIEGITLPVGNTTEEIQDSVCAITDYLHNHLPPIIKNHTQQHWDNVTSNAKAFLIQFEAAVNKTFVPKQCHRNVSMSHGYHIKKIGLRIIYSARQWVENFIGKKSSCD